MAGLHDTLPRGTLQLILPALRSCQAEPRLVHRPRKLSDLGSAISHLEARRTDHTLGRHHPRPRVDLEGIVERGTTEPSTEYVVRTRRKRRPQILPS